MRQLNEAREERDRIAELLAAAKNRVDDCQLAILILMEGGGRSVRKSPPLPVADDAEASLPAQVRAYFDRNPDRAMTADDLIRGGLGAQPDHLRSTLNRLCREDGFLKRVSRGVYIRAESKEASGS
jgi:hypothetical protein